MLILAINGFYKVWKLKELNKCISTKYILTYELFQPFNGGNLKFDLVVTFKA